MRLLANFTAGLVLAASLFGVPAFADGSQTGVVSGVVTDEDGAPIEGVPVRLDGERGAREALSDTDGRFRFPALPVGGYRLSAELLGLTASLDEVLSFVDKTTEVELVLGEDAGAEPATETRDWIRVVASAPIVDRFETRVGGNVRFDFLDELPVPRFYQSVALLLPGIAGGQDGNPNVSGSLRSNNLYLIDGVDTTDPTTGLFGLNLSYEAIEEVAVTTAGHPAEYGRASGAVINVVTRSGGNDYRGTARWIATNNDWNESYDYPVEEIFHLAPQIIAANSGPDDLDATFSLTLGGPLKRDRAWFFAAYEDGERSFLRPTRQGTLWNEGAQQESAALKLTFQPTASTTLIAQHTSDAASFTAYSPFDRGPGENRVGPSPSRLSGSVVDRIPGELFTLEGREQDGSFNKLQLNSALSQSLSLEINLADQERELSRDPFNLRGLTSNAPHVGVTRFALPGGDLDNLQIQEVALFNGITDRGRERRPRQQGSAALSGFFTSGAVDHEITVGLDYQETESERNFNVPGRAGIDRATGRAVDGQIFIDIDLRPPCLFEGDCTPFSSAAGTFQPFALFNFWRRPDRLTREESLAFHISDSMAFGNWVLNVGARWEAVEGSDGNGRALVDDTVLSPRIALTYDPEGEGRTLYSLSWARFHEPFLQNYLDTFGSFEFFSGFTEYIWLGFAEPACSAFDPANIDSPCWFPTGGVGFVRDQNSAPNLSLDRASVDELIVGFERQLTPTTALSIHYIDREWDDLWDNLLAASGGGAVISSSIQNLEPAERTYRALQLLVQRRYADRWQLLGSYTLAEAEGNLFRNDSLSSFADFAALSDVNLVNRFGPAPYDRRHQAQVFANYQIPLERLGLSFGSALRYESGVPFQAESLDPLGVRFLSPRGSERTSDVFQWDLSAGADFRLGPAIELETKLEIFNLTNEQNTLGAESIVESGVRGLPRSLLDLQSPRNYRLTVGIRF